jgi:predicted deacetylase
MKKYYFRLDDACECLDIEKWNKIEKIFDKHNLFPLVGVIPNCDDQDLKKYPNYPRFWNKIRYLEEKGWIIALHGYSHVYDSKEGGINPVHQRSEFAGKSLDVQKELINKGLETLNRQKLNPVVFFAPSHTFDENTLIAIKECSNIRVISDTIARKRYKYKDITFVPQQSGKVRKVPFCKEITFCYHPNTMTENDFTELDEFITKHRKNICNFDYSLTEKKKTFLDYLLSKLYFIKRKFYGKR